MPTSHPDVPAQAHLAPALRPITEQDMQLLLALYGDTRAEEMKLFPFDEAQKQQFLQMQFWAQHQHYQSTYNNASFDCICLGDEVIGRLYVNRNPDDMRIVDICLFARHCGKGIGSHFLQQLILESEQSGTQLSAHVELNNPARALYQRLGFKEVELRGPYVFVIREVKKN